MIGIGLNDEKDISIKGLESIKKCKYVYLELYTSMLNVPISKLENLYGKKIIISDRSLIENTNEIMEKSKKHKLALLIIGDVFSATTHINFLLECKKNNIECKIIHNASVITAVGEIGLEIYKYGKTTSIPFDYSNINTPIEVINQNIKSNLHTLVLLDLDPKDNKFLRINEAIKYLISKGFNENKKIIACCALGGDSEIKYETALNLSKMNFEKMPQCIIVPSNKLHFVEEEALDIYSA